ncbi:MAG: calcium/sodium antiporter [Christensenellales bacterium]|jgi:cation:H+ antiporter
MHVFTAVIFFAAGLVMIIKGGDIFVDAARAIAGITGIPKIIIGATIVSVATTLPELLVSLLATAQGSPDFASGNAIGSVSANMGLILGVSLTAMPSPADRKSLLSKGLLMMASAAVLCILSLDESLTARDSLLMLGMLSYFIYINIKSLKNQGCFGEERLLTSKKTKQRIVFRFALGAAAIAFGAHLLVEKGEALAHIMGIPGGIIGLTLVAVGTSLPELATTLSAIRKRESALSVGNILGANIIDLCLILPACSFLSGGQLPVSRTIALLDIPFAVLLMSIAIIPALISGRFRRWQGVLMLILYGAYIAFSVHVS